MLRADGKSMTRSEQHFDVVILGAESAGVFVAGDGVGKSPAIVGAAVNGLMAA
jgi:hypothetical protein